MEGGRCSGTHTCTMHCSHSEGLGLRTKTTPSGSSRAHQAGLAVVLGWVCSPVSPADLGTASIRLGAALQVGPGTVAGRPGDAWSCLGLC